MTPYVDIDLGQHWLICWRVAWRRQAITRINVDSSSVRSGGIHLWAISQKLLKLSILGVSLNITYLRSEPHLTRVNELNLCSDIVYVIVTSSITMAAICRSIWTPLVKWRKAKKHSCRSKKNEPYDRFYRFYRCRFLSVEYSFIVIKSKQILFATKL